MAIVAGIDEAGLGPVLGPLIVSATAFEVPDEAVDACLWDLLGGVVARTPSKRRRTLAVGDSKKLYSRKRPNALEHLERGVLAMLGSRGARPATLEALLELLAPGSARRAGTYPWYGRAELPLPHCISGTDAALSTNALKVGLEAAGVKLVAMVCQPIFVGEYNRLVAATRNKSTALFDVTSRLLVDLWGRLPAKGGRIRVDRQGGRMRYLPPLQRLFDGARFKILEECETRSAYRIVRDGREVEIDFCTGADGKHLPVALASMASKYVRELLMTLLNRYWATHVPGLAPTAGYYVDGRRFYAEIAPAVRRMGTDPALLYRSR